MSDTGELCGWVNAGLSEKEAALVTGCDRGKREECRMRRIRLATRTHGNRAITADITQRNCGP